MSLIWMDGFDQYTSTNNGVITTGMQSSGYTGFGFYQQGGGARSDTRTGVGWSIWFGYLGGFGRAYQSCSSIITGFGLKYTDALYRSITRLGCNNFLGSEPTVLELMSNANGAITAIAYHLSGSQGPVYHSAENVLFPGIWHYVEILYTPGLSGTLIVKVDGVAVISVVGAPTVGTNQVGTVNTMSFPQLGANSGERGIDDWYILSNDGVGLTDFLGDVVVHAIFPNGDATPNELSQFGGSFGHYSTVIDRDQGDDNSYLYTTEPNKVELFTLSQLPTDMMDVLAVQVATRARKDSAGISNYSLLARLGEDLYTSSPVSTTTQYLTKFAMLETPPGGGSWNLAKAQALQIGFKTVE